MKTKGGIEEVDLRVDESARIRRARKQMAAMLEGLIEEGEFSGNDKLKDVIKALKESERNAKK